MNNFVRAIKVAFRYPTTLFSAFATSLLIAVLWGGNIGALYPIFAVVLEGKPLHDWVAEEIGKSKREIQELNIEIAELERQSTIAFPNVPKELQRKRNNAKSKLSAVERDLYMSEKIKPWIDRLMPRDPFQTVVVIVGVLMVATIVKDACIVANMVLVSKLIQQVAVDFQQQLYDHVLRCDLPTFSKRGTSGLLTHMTNDVGGLCNGLSNLFGGAIREPLKMLACLSVAAYICWRLLFFSLILAPVAFILMRLLGASLKRASRRWLEHGQEVNRLIFESFNGIQTVQAYTMEEHESARFAHKLRETVRKAMRIVWYSALTKPATEILGLGVVCLSLLAGAYLVLNDATKIFNIPMSDRPLSLESLLVFYGLLVGASDPARKMSEVFSGIQGGVAAADRIYPILDEKPSIADPAEPIAITKPHRQLIFENVGFQYTPDQPVLKDINLTIEFGETVAIVGPNGCGKSTLMNLLPRFYDPEQGLIRLDGVSLAAMRLADLRGRIGIVAQNAILFDDTVANNIRYGNPLATREQIVEAAKKAYAHQFIEEKLDAGYATNVGQGGGRLSGGQRQRIALARAILRDPEILILDEATSQVDLESEQLIHRVLERFVRGRTTIIITHRLSTLALASRIIVMEAGRIQDMGRHEELLHRCELYRRLHEMQFKRSA